MRYYCGSAQHVGDRSDQQDSLAIEIFSKEFAKHAGILLLVADGMGGLEHGAIASKTALTAFVKAYKEKSPEERIDTALRRSLDTANELVYAINQANAFRPETGTTLVAAVVFEDTVSWVSVGDSRLYVLRDKAVHQLSHDHTFSQFLEKHQKDILSEEEIHTHPDSEALTSFLGLPALIEVHASDRPVQLKGGDHVFLCSDGLYRGLQVEDVVSCSEANAQTMANSLIACVIEKRLPKQDNASVAVLFLKKTWAEILEPFQERVRALFAHKPAITEPRSCLTDSAQSNS